MFPPSRRGQQPMPIMNCSETALTSLGAPAGSPANMVLLEAALARLLLGPIPGREDKLKTLQQARSTSPADMAEARLEIAKEASACCACWQCRLVCMLCQERAGEQLVPRRCCFAAGWQGSRQPGSECCPVWQRGAPRLLGLHTLDVLLTTTHAHHPTLRRWSGRRGVPWPLCSPCWRPPPRRARLPTCWVCQLSLHWR